MSRKGTSRSKGQASEDANDKGQTEFASLKELDKNFENLSNEIAKKVKTEIIKTLDEKEKKINEQLTTKPSIEDINKQLTAKLATQKDEINKSLEVINKQLTAKLATQKDEINKSLEEINKQLTAKLATQKDEINKSLEEINKQLTDKLATQKVEFNDHFQKSEAFFRAICEKLNLDYEQIKQNLPSNTDSTHSYRKENNHIIIEEKSPQRSNHGPISINQSSDQNEVPIPDEIPDEISINQSSDQNEVPIPDEIPEEVSNYSSDQNEIPEKIAKHSSDQIKSSNKNKWASFAQNQDDNNIEVKIKQISTEVFHSLSKNYDKDFEEKVTKISTNVFNSQKINLKLKLDFDNHNNSLMMKTISEDEN